jgi:hypothetical protein
MSILLTKRKLFKACNLAGATYKSTGTGLFLVTSGDSSVHIKITQDGQLLYNKAKSCPVLSYSIQRMLDSLATTGWVHDYLPVDK